MTMKNIKDIRARVEKALDRVRPALANDGGGVEVAGLSPEGRLHLKFTGACGGCPFALQTLQQGIETVIVSDVPEVTEIVAEDAATGKRIGG